MFYGGKENVFKVETTPLVSKGLHESVNDKIGEKNRTTEGGGNAEPGGFVTVCQESKCLFSKDYIIVCHFGLPFYYLLFVNGEKTLHHVSCQKKKKKNWKETSDSDLWHSSLANRGKNQDE